MGSMATSNTEHSYLTAKIKETLTLSVNKALEQFLTSMLVLYHLANNFITQMDRYPFC